MTMYKKARMFRADVLFFWYSFRQITIRSRLPQKQSAFFVWDEVSMCDRCKSRPTARQLPFIGWPDVDWMGQLVDDLPLQAVLAHELQPPGTSWVAVSACLVIMIGIAGLSWRP